MKQINYQGQEISVDQVAEINVVRGAGMEFILRDEAGRYYFRRETYVEGVGYYAALGDPMASNYRCLLHRININAAILWAIGSSGGNRLLRRDAADLLMDGRSYHDPYPRRYEPRHEAALPLQAPANVSGTRRFSDGSMTVTMHLKPTVASLVRAAAEIDEDTPLGVAWTGLGDNVLGVLIQGGREREKELITVFNDNLPDEDAPAGNRLLRLINPQDGSVWDEGVIDNDLYDAVQVHAERTGVDWAAAMVNLVKECVAKKVAIDEQDADPATVLEPKAEKMIARLLAIDPCDRRDVINAAVIGWLGLALQDGKVDHGWGADVEAARRRRVRRGGRDARPAQPAVMLSPEANALVARYLRETTFDAFTAIDVVSGCVEHALGMALRDLEEALNSARARRDRTFADDAWGYVEKDVYNAYRRRLGLPGYDEQDDNAEADASDERAARRLSQTLLPVYTQEQLSEIGRAQAASIRRVGEHDPADVFSLSTPNPMTDCKTESARKPRQGQPRAHGGQGGR